MSTYDPGRHPILSFYFLPLVLKRGYASCLKAIRLSIRGVCCWMSLKRDEVVQAIVQLCNCASSGWESDRWQIAVDTHMSMWGHY